MARRTAPSWAATTFVVLLLVGYFVYSAARLRSAAVERAKVPGATHCLGSAEAGAASARP